MVEWAKWLLSNTDGRANVFHMWISGALYFAILIPLAIPKMFGDGVFSSIVLILAALVLFYFKVMIGVKRCHDHGWSGTMYLLSFVPLVNIYMFLMLYCVPGDKEENKYGTRPGWVTAPVKLTGVEPAKNPEY